MTTGTRWGPLHSPREVPGAVREPALETDDVIEHVTTRQRRGRQHPRIALNLTAMIDVTFLLLVYFMVATQFKLGEEIYRLDLPERGVIRESDPFALDDEPLRIQVATTGFMPGAYSVRIQGPYQQPASFDALHEFLRVRRISDEVPGGLFLPDHPIIVQPTPTTKWQHALEAFNACARARYTNITLGGEG